MQNDVDKLVEWSRKWKLGFNEDKCKIMNIGNSKIGKTEVNMISSNGEIKSIKETSVERDLGIMLNNKLDWNDQVDHAVHKAQSVLGMLKRTFVFWNASMFLKLYTGYVRPHLEYCATVWNPYRKKEIRSWKKYNVERQNWSRISDL